jgi:ketosteroid isomerase-like protein
MNASDRIERLEDREAIYDLLKRYCYLIAAADVDGVIDLFTSDCVVEVLGTRYEGESGLRSLYASSLEFHPKPYIHNHLLEDLEADTASGRCVLEIRQLRDGQPEVGGGCYEDLYRKQAGGWKFEARTFRNY